MTVRKKDTILYLFTKVQNIEPITWLTCADYRTSYGMEQSALDIILVGDML